MNKDTYFMKCRKCGKEGYFKIGGYIGRCECGSYDTEVRMPRPQAEKGWEERFDEKFKDVIGDIEWIERDSCFVMDDIRLFIRQVEQEAKEEERERIIKWAEETLEKDGSGMVFFYKLIQFLKR